MNDMKKLDDQKIQELLENKALSEDTIAQNPDIHLYNKLFAALKKEPEISLPFGFAAFMTNKIKAQQIKQTSFKSYVIAFATTGLILIASCMFLFVFQTALVLQLYAFLFSVKYILVTAILAFLMVQYLDQKFVKKRFS